MKSTTLSRGFYALLRVVYSDECHTYKLSAGAALYMSITEDRRNLDGLRDLDQQIIGAVYDQYFSEVYRYVLYRIGDQVLAEDIASDVFVRLLEAVKSGRAPQTNLRGWLIGTASHIVADHMRKKYHRPEEQISESLPDLQPGPVTEVDQREQNRIVQSAYAQLTPDQQDVLALRFGQGYSLEETATFMNKNVNAVKALQFRALSALQREIGEVDYD
ncbi:MAG: sigma-70 family RNA polymerase sigma factor [Anaerolineales bacterium]